MIVALTLTHGNSYGAQVVVDGLGLILGHGMSRFDPVPGRSNSVAPGKRPLHNMCPTIVFRDAGRCWRSARPAADASRTRSFRCSQASSAKDSSLEQAVRVPRLHTEGGMNIHAEAGFDKPSPSD